MKNRMSVPLFVSIACGCASMADASDEASAVKTPPEGCQLSGGAFDEQVAEIDAIFAERLEVRELEDGYTFRFPGDDDLAARLLTFVATERRCCTFFGFELSFAPERGPVWLGVSGSPEVKALVASWLGLGEDGR